MITVTIIAFILSSGEVRSIYGTEAQCQMYQKMHMEHSLFVDDLDLPKQEPREVMCQCVSVEMEEWE